MANSTTGHKTILVAEDDDADFRLTEVIFSEYLREYRLLRAKDGEEVEIYLRDAASFPDLILLDLNMPRKNGRSVLKDIQKDPKLREIPVIVFSTSTAEEDQDFVQDLGYEFVTKPLDLNEYIAFIRSLNNYF